MPYDRPPPTPSEDAWDVITGRNPVTATPHGYFNTPDNPNKSHLDATTYRSAAGEPRGLSVGAGVWDGPVPGAGPNRSVRGLDGRLDVGRFVERDGTQAYGFNAEAGLQEFQGEQLEVGMASASARAKVSSKGAELGVQADGPQAAWTNKEAGTASDEMHRAGFSPFGPGAELRGHWADEDGDRHREYGFGADIGDFSFDFTTEDPLRSLARSLSYESIGGRQDGKDQRNWTSEAIDSVKNLFGHFAD